MRAPIRTRLTVWYVALFAVVVAAWSALVIARLHHDFYAVIDQGLAARTTQLAGLLTADPGTAFAQASDSTLGGVAPAEAISQLVSAEGIVLGHSGDPVGASPVVSLGFLRDAVAGKARIATIRLHGERFRVLVTRVSGTRRYLLVAQSTESSDTAARNLALVMLLSGPFALLAAAIVGWFLARQALHPVSRMTSAAAGVGIDRLGDRVPVPEADDELRALAQTLNHMLDRLEAGVRDKRALVANASHELQTPLAVMRTELDVYLESDVDAGQREVLESVREEVDRMTRIVRNLLALARFDDGRLELLREPVDLNAIAETVVDSLAATASEHGVSVSVAGGPAFGRLDAEFMRLVISNLVDNALRYAGAGSRIEVVTRELADEVVLVVSDNGVGIPRASVPHVFDRFYRVDDAREKGTGLGLSISKEIVEAHGGSIALSTKTGMGTTFKVRIPSRS